MLMFSGALLASKEVASKELVSNEIAGNGLATKASAVQEAVMTAPPLASSQDQLIQVTLSLFAVLAVIYAVAWLIKRNRGVQGLSGLPMKTLAVLPMGVKEKIVLIEVGGKQILLGMTAHNINALATFDEPVLVIKEKNSKGFADRLKEIMSQVKQDNQVSPQDGNTNPVNKSSESRS